MIDTLIGVSDVFTTLPIHSRHIHASIALPPVAMYVAMKPAACNGLQLLYTDAVIYLLIARQL